MSESSTPRLPAFDPGAVTETNFTSYPEPYRAANSTRYNRRLADHAGLKNFGVNLTRIIPGGQSSFRHAHSRQDEFIYVLQGEVVLETNDGEQVLRPGMCAGFPAGTGDAHRFVNRTASDVTLLVIGDRTPGDEISYPDVDMHAVLAPDGVYRLRTRSRRQLRQRIAQILQRGALAVGRFAELLGRRHEVAVVVDGVADHRIELWMRLRRHARTIAPDETPQRLGILRIRRRHQRQQELEGDGHVGLLRLAGMDVPDGIAELLLDILPREPVEELLIVVDVARDHVEIEPLRRLRLAVHEQRQRFRRRIAQPFVDRKPVALRLRNLLALLVEEQLVIETLGRRAAERRADLAGQLDGIDQVLAGHFIVDAEREPTHRPVRLPLQLAMPAGHGNGDALPGLGI